jgi:saccharopine dehydrogenase-like NADP-dependent oxidoreductase
VWRKIVPATRVAVLGTGLIGRVICEDLLDEPGFKVLAIDGQDSSLALLPDHPRLERRRADLSDQAAVARLTGEADLAVGAVPGALGRGVQRGVLAAGRPMVDISFAPENPLELHDEVAAAGLTFIVDCGLAPGLSNLLVGREASRMETVDEVMILVGGLPLRRDWPWEYRFVFSPGDVIEEYTRPCHIRVAGKEITCEPLTEIEPVEFAGVGTLEAFLTDGLRTLLHTIPAPTLREKTLRYPGHAERMRALKATGFFSTEPLALPGGTVAPRALTESLFRSAMALPAGQREISLLRVVVRGSDVAGVSREVRWDLQDTTDDRGRTSMSRTTGFPCAEAVRLVASGLWRRPGVSPPETLGAEAGPCEALLAGMERRGISLARSQED